MLGSSINLGRTGVWMSSDGGVRLGMSVSIGCQGKRSLSVLLSAGLKTLAVEIVSVVCCSWGSSTMLLQSAKCDLQPDLLATIL